MLKYFTLVLLALGLFFFLSCDPDEQTPFIQEDLAYTKWQVTGFMPAGTSELRSSQIKYMLEFVNDSVFLLTLDANRLVGKYGYSPNGDFQIIEAKHTNDCCDSQFALEMVQVFREARKYAQHEGGVTFSGNGEIYLLKK